MGKLITTTLLTLLFVSTFCIAQKEKAAKKELNKEIDKYIRETMHLHEIPGLALGVLKEGKVIHKGFYGNASIEHNVPVCENTIFRVYSTTKLMTSTAVFQLIERDEISLEDNTI